MRLKAIGALLALGGLMLVGCDTSANGGRGFTSLPSSADGTWQKDGVAMCTIADSTMTIGVDTIYSLQVDGSGGLYYSTSGTSAALAGYAWDGQYFIYYGVQLTKRPPVYSYFELSSAADGTWSKGGTDVFTISNSRMDYDGKSGVIIYYDIYDDLHYEYSGNYVALTGYTWDGSSIGFSGIALALRTAAPVDPVVPVVPVTPVMPSANADLLGVTVSRGSLSPAFSPSVLAYSMIVANSVTAMTVDATRADADAAVKISPSQPAALNEGANTISVTVTAQDGTVKAYAVTIVRLAATPPLLTMRDIPGGSFQRDATAGNTSAVSAFRMSDKEVTRAQFSQVVGGDPSNTAYSAAMGCPVQMTNWYHALAFCDRLSIAEGLVPVYSVSGVDFATLAFADIPTGVDLTWSAVTTDWAADGYRLPTVMEWMWAAMGADTEDPGQFNATGYLKAFSGSGGGNAIDDYAWYGVNSDDVNHIVGTKLPNELGLYDMSGNVFEWGWDRYAGFPPAFPSGQLSDFAGQPTGDICVSLGGARNSGAGNFSFGLQNAANAKSQSNGIGFRVARR